MFTPVHALLIGTSITFSSLHHFMNNLPTEIVNANSVNSVLYCSICYSRFGTATSCLYYLSIQSQHFHRSPDQNLYASLLSMLLYFFDTTFLTPFQAKAHLSIPFTALEFCKQLCNLRKLPQHSTDRGIR